MLKWKRATVLHQCSHRRHCKTAWWPLKGPHRGPWAHHHLSAVQATLRLPKAGSPGGSVRPCPPPRPPSLSPQSCRRSPVSAWQASAQGRERKRVSSKAMDGELPFHAPGQVMLRCSDAGCGMWAVACPLHYKHRAGQVMLRCSDPAGAHVDDAQHVVLLQRLLADALRRAKAGRGHSGL